MAGSFSSVQSALSAIRYNAVALDVASNNISNAATEGYVRRRVQAEAVGGPEVPALWSRYGGHGDGVRVAGMERMVDGLLDTRVRREHGALTYLKTTQTVLQRLENGIGEPGPDGVSQALIDFRKSWADLANNPGSDAARQQVLGRASTLALAMHNQYTNVTAEEADQRVHLLSAVSEVNTAATDLAALNQTILGLEINGTDASTLRDSRDSLALRLAELTGATVTVRPDGMYDVSVGGQALVTGDTAGSLSVTSGVTPTGDADGGPIVLEIEMGGVRAVVPAAGIGGETGAVVELLSSTLPSYRAGLDAIALELATAVNDQHRAGFDSAGAGGGDFFAFDPAAPAGSLTVAITDPALVAASGVPGARDGSNADALGDAGAVEESYQRLVNTFGTEVAALQRRTANQAALTGSIDDAWEQQAGVNLDEETVAMMTAQRAYEAAARLMTTLDEVLDTLINRTGLVGR